MDEILKARVLAVLKAVEFGGKDWVDPWDEDYGVESCCPVCGATEMDEHRYDCKLAALIKELSDDGV